MKDDLKDIDRLRKLSGVDAGFKVPLGYFDTLESRVEAHREVDSTQEKPQVSLVRLLKPMLTLAACFVLAILLFKYPAQQLLRLSEEPQLQATANLELIELEASLSIDDAYLAELILHDEKAQNPKDTERMLDELTCYVSDLDVVWDVINE